MPASVADPVACVLRTTLGGKKGPFSSSSPSEAENNPDLLEDRLAASAKRVLLSTIDYEPAPKQQVFSTDLLKSKYTVLTSNSSHSSKLAAINGVSQVTSQESLPAPKVTLFRNEDVRVGWKGQVPIGTGMVNMGNTCYMNSTLQALFHVPSFSNWLTGDQPCQTCQNSSQLCLVCVVAKTLQSTREKHASVVKPLPIYTRLKQICKHMVHGRQEDAHEFMRYLMEAMEKSYLQGVGGTKLDSRSKETNPLGQIFGGYIRTEVTCLKCKHTSTTFQHFQDIPLDIQHASTLEDGLAHYFRRERLEGDNAYKCDKCKTKVPATKKFSLERAPNVLCIQLKRFGLMGGKMSKHIQYSRTLNLGRFLFNNNQSGGSTLSGSTPPTYKFVSLINHMGPSQHCGHYTAIAEASNGNLYLFDDCSVRLISANTALSTGAYVLIYERVQSSSMTPTASSLKANSVQNSSQPAAASPPAPRVMVPRPAIIAEPSRPKVSITFNKKAEPVQQPQQQQKPRLVMLNGATSLFKKAASPNLVQPATTASSSQTNGVQPLSTPSKTPLGASGSKLSPPKAVAALVPYDGESTDEEEPEKPIKNGLGAVVSNGTHPESTPPVTKTADTKWQVSPSPTPSENVTTNGTALATCNVSASKWRVSENNQQDNSSNNSSASSSGSSSQSKWNVRSMSDTEVDRTGQSTTSELKQYHSDTETEKPCSAVSSVKNLESIEESKKNDSEAAAEVTTLKPADTLTHPASASSSPPKTEEKKVPTTQVENFPSADAPPVVDKPVKSNHNPKWDGSRGNDTVKELLRMSHSGFGDQVRTWDGGKSHLTKQVEEDKRVQRKRTADELLDEEMDKGKVKKVKSKEESRDSSPARNGYNPFQLFQDRKREQQQQMQHSHHKSDHGKNNFSRNHHRNGYQGHRGGRGGRGGGSDRQHHHRSRHQPWRRFR